MSAFKDEKSGWRRTKEGWASRRLNYAYMFKDPFLLFFRAIFEDMYHFLYSTRTALGMAMNWTSYPVYINFSIAIVIYNCL